MNKILCIDDDKDILQLLALQLASAGYEVRTAAGPKAGLAAAANDTDVILLDVMMPGMSGYEVCAALQKNTATAKVPVIFLSALGQKQDKLRAFASGGADYLVKPFDRATLVEAVNRNLRKKTAWEKKPAPPPQSALPGPGCKDPVGCGDYDLQDFKKIAAAVLMLDPARRARLAALGPAEIYRLAEIAETDPGRVARLIASFAKLPYIPMISPDDIKLGVLPPRFARQHNLIAMQVPGSLATILTAHPFDFEVNEMLRGLLGDEYRMAITEPENISAVYLVAEEQKNGEHIIVEDSIVVEKKAKEKLKDLSKGTLDEIDGTPVKYIAGKMLEMAISERASDIHLEPKDAFSLVRFRINGDLQEFKRLKKETGRMVIARFKALSGLDIAERRRPQDGAFSFSYRGGNYTLRLATTSTNYGESLVMRLIKSSVKARTLSELGMAATQIAAMEEISKKTQGIVLLVGPTGSGKTTTIFSFLSNIDCRKRSLISVEDPIEYRIPFANQQQVNEKAGVTFQALLKSSVRQDPDMLFIGEVRDLESASIALDFSSAGHMTISTLHASNATAAIFRLERLGITRSQIAESLLAVVSQRLVKKLCPHCRRIAPPTAEELVTLSRFSAVRPAYLAAPAGCSECRNTGYSGREAVYEIMRVDPGVSGLIRKNTPIAGIREYLKGRGEIMLADSVIAKVLGHTVALKDAYDKVLAEELAPAEGDDASAVPAPEAAAE